MLQSGRLLETRAVRLRPPPLSGANWVADTFEETARAGFNVVILDALFNGFTCWPRELKKWRPIREHPALLGFDFLAEACRRAAEYEMGIYAGIDLLVSGRRRYFPKSRLARARRQWHIRTRGGRRFPKTGPDAGTYFLCPNNTEARMVLIGALNEMAEAYPIHGIFLDHFSWPEADDSPNDEACFCPACIALAREEVHIDLAALRAGKASEQDVQAWRKWQAERIVQLLYTLRARIQKGRWTVRMILNAPAEFLAETLVSWSRENVADILCIPWERQDVLGSPEIANNAALALLEANLQQLTLSEATSGHAGTVYSAGSGLRDDEIEVIRGAWKGVATPVEIEPLENAVALIREACNVAGSEICSGLEQVANGLVADNEGEFEPIAAAHDAILRWKARVSHPEAARLLDLADRLLRAHQRF